MHVLQFEVCFRSLSSVTKRRAGELATERYPRRLAAMDDRAETQRIEERLPQGTDEWLTRPRLSTTSRGTITPVVILQPLSAPVGDVVMYTGPLQPIGWQLHGIGREFGGGTQPADVAVEAGAITQDKRRVDVGPTRASKSRRMDRRLTHWQCIYCRRETRNDARATSCWNCGGEKEQLRDADSEGREAARRGQRAKEYAGRSLNALGAGTSLVPRAAQGVFERARVDVLVHWETQQLEQYTGAASYLRKEESMLGVMESYYVCTRALGAVTFAITAAGGDVTAITKNARTFSEWYSDTSNAVAVALLGRGGAVNVALMRAAKEVFASWYRPGGRLHMPGHESHLASPAGFEDFEVPGSVVRDVLRSLFSRETKSWVTKVERAQGLMLALSTTASSRTMRSGRVVDFAVEDRDVDARRPSWEEETQPVEGTRDISNGYRSSSVATWGALFGGMAIETAPENSFAAVAESDAIWRQEASQERFDADAEASSLHSLLHGSSAAAVAAACAETSSSVRYDAARAAWPAAATADRQQLGGAIRQVVDALDAPHLKPSGIEKRLLGGTHAACLGLITLLNQMSALSPPTSGDTA
ncbi:hypothetical protein EMIHUDRAFT_99338 [Emiliania huxleyi CCMP1516]|uniref:RanBP2-type domain-containing protein n=2 Tax=Emiliania huxleyi TaxID=2903 RepID=A0A0D3K5S5_EMIH1|nr:hypothetical protein EMIHUDRAFT_99338 [Emiliania huxleyi CCMP1516]EOD31110.1 hypothetical protein EMIHUDRAFT_99338 [Emiliania huxleyi CCMP1516]|eukprot:XP_005783539.1 hypothetical protein EMIHUDRAFT_99338 [Emiliania huxleyi CCMP1516]